MSKMGLLGAMSGLGQGMSQIGHGMAQDIRAKDAEARQRALEEWRIAKQEEYQINRETRAAAAQEASDRRSASMRIQAREGAERDLQDRGFEDFKRKLGATSMTEEELRQVYNEQYHDRVLGSFEGADQFMPSGVDRAEAVLRQKQNMGAPSGLLAEADRNVAAERTMERQRSEDRRRDEQFRLQQDRLAETERANRAREDAAEARLANAQRATDAQLARLASGGSSGGASRTETEEQRITWLQARLAAAARDMPKPPERNTPRALELYQKQLEDWRNSPNGRAHATLERELDDLIMGRSSAPSPAPATAPQRPDATDTQRGATPPVNLLQPNKVTTFANGQRWTLKDGKAVQVQ